jgi:predicted DNA-binding protein (MmcQ/YjbR family)
MDEKYQSTDANHYCGLKPGTLEAWRFQKRSPAPAYYKVGSKIWYLKKDLDAYLESVRVVA